MDARGQQRERLHQALDVRVIAHIPGELQAPSDLGVALCEIGRAGAQEGQLAFVMGQEVVHGTAGDGEGR